MKLEHQIDNAISIAEKEIDGIHTELHDIAPGTVRAHELSQRLDQLWRAKKELRQAAGALEG